MTAGETLYVRAENLKYDESGNSWMLVQQGLVEGNPFTSRVGCR